MKNKKLNNKIIDGFIILAGLIIATIIGLIK